MKPKWEFLSCHRLEDFPDIVAEVRTGGFVTLTDIGRITDEMLERVGDNGDREYETRISGSYVTLQNAPYPIPTLEIVLRATTTTGARMPLVGQSPDAAEKQRLIRIAEGRG